MSKPKKEVGEYKVTQWYDKIEKDPEKQKLFDYPNKDRVNLKLPGRFLITGPTGSGKTTTLVEIIHAYGVFEKIIIITKMPEEDLYQMLQKKAELTAKKAKVPLSDIFVISSDLNDIPEEKSFDKKSNTFIVIDDFVNSKKTEIKRVLDLWIMGRKLSISMAWLTQSFFLTDKVIRQNSQYIIFKKMADLKNLKLIMDLYKMNTPLQDVVKMCADSTSASDTTQFFMIDVLTDNPDLRYRHCFKGIKQPDNNLNKIKN